jgi:SNF2 family DNA or RNA helicase
VIVFAQHLHVLTLLCEAFETAGYQTARIDGSVSQKKRSEIVEAFQNDPALTFVVAQLDAASESITLTSSSTVFFVESSWTPTRNYQAASRAHRRGQTNKVLARFLTLEDTLDDSIARALRAKMASIQAVTGSAAA